MSAIFDLAIIGIFKNEESFLPEWLDHYFTRNIDHIYLINDNSSDNSVDIVLSHPNKNNITLCHTDNDDWVYNKYWKQEYLYNKYFQYSLQTTKWLGVFDLDEFVYAPDEINFKNILLSYNDKPQQELIIDWYWFGSNGLEEQPKSIINNFIKRSKNLSKTIIQTNNLSHMGYHPDWCCKSFAKTQYISSIRHHYNKFYYYNKTDYISHGKNISFSHNLSDSGSMYINHYIGSKNYYFNNKINRGSCNNNYIITNNKKSLYNFINLNEIEDIRLKNQQQLTNI